MKLPISKIEKATGYKVKSNCESIGFDTANRSGIAFIKTSKNSVNIDFMFIEFNSEDKPSKYKIMVNTFENLLKKQTIATVEDVFVGFNRKGSIELARYGAFAISECIRKNIPYEIISAVSCRSKLGIKTKKGKSKESVAEWLHKNLNIKLYDNDISDAICLALLGILEGLDFRSNAQIKKDK